MELLCISASINVQTPMYACGHTCSQGCVCMCVRESLILPDYVAGLWKAACHKEAFDDVDFLIHGLRQAGGNWDSQRKSEKRQNAKRLRSPASTNSMFNTEEKIKIKNDPAATMKGKATNCTRESRQVTTYSNGGKLTLPLWSRQINY